MRISAINKMPIEAVIKQADTKIVEQKGNLNIITELSDEELVTKIKAGSQAAFAELTKRYMEKSYAIAFNMVGNSEAAKDLSQDVFVKIYSTIGSFKEGSKFFSWYYRILLNHCINYQRRQKIVSMIPFSEMFISDENNNYETNFLKDENSEESDDRVSLVRKAINDLSAKHRKVVMLYDIEGVPQEEIAEILNISVGTVRSRLHYARKCLKKQLNIYLKEI